MLGISDRLYRWMVGLYPKEFRSEFGSEMIQSFRDDCRGELREGSLLNLSLFWGRTLLDFVTSAPIEYLKRRQTMNVMEKDLRWDVNYGLQMLFKHSMLVLKYSFLCAAAVFVLFVLAHSRASMAGSMMSP